MANYSTNLKTWGATGSEYPTGYSQLEGEQPVDEWHNNLFYNTIEDIKHLTALTNDRVESNKGTNTNRPSSPETAHLYYNETDERLEHFDSSVSEWHGLLKADGDTLQGALDTGGYGISNVGALGMSGDIDLSSNNLTDGATTIWDGSNGYVNQSALQNDSLTVNAGTGLVGGGSVSLGGSVTIDFDETGVNADKLDGEDGNYYLLDAEEDGSASVSDITSIDFTGHLNVIDDGDGTITLDPTHNHDSRYIEESGDTMEGDLNGNDGSYSLSNFGSVGVRYSGWDGGDEWQMKARGGTTADSRLSLEFWDDSSSNRTEYINLNKGGPIHLRNASIQIDEGQAIQDDTGTERVLIKSNYTQIKNEDGDETYRASGGFSANYVESGRPFQVRDSDNQHFLLSVKSGNPGELAIKNTQLNFANSYSIQDAGTDAIWFDGSANLTLPNGSLTVSGGNVNLDSNNIEASNSRILTGDTSIYWNFGSSGRLTLVDENQSSSSQIDYVAGTPEIIMGSSGVPVRFRTNVQINEGQAIQDDTGTERVLIKSNYTQIKNENGDELYRASSGFSANYVDSGQPWRVYDWDNSHTQIEVTSGDPGTFELTNARLNMSNNEITFLSKISYGNAGYWYTNNNNLHYNNGSQSTFVIESGSPGLIGVKNSTVKNYTGDYKEGVKVHSGVSGTVDLDLEKGNVHHVEANGDVTITLSNVSSSPAGNSLVIYFTDTDGSGPHTISWPSSFEWSNANPKTSIPGSSDIEITAITGDGGTAWRARPSGVDFA